MNEKALAIVDQVRRLYQRYGIKSVTMDDVARHLNISKKTVYEHFRDKEDLVRYVLMTEHQHRMELFDAMGEQNYNAIEEMFEIYKIINTAIRDYNHSMEYDVRKYYPDLYMKIREIKRKRMYDVSYRNLNKGKKEGLYRKDLHSRIIARLHVFRTESMMDTDIFTVEELTSMKVFHEIFLYHIHGILSHEGRAFFEANFDRFKASLA